MVPSLSRRQVLAGGALAGAAGGLAFAPPTYLPDGVAVARASMRPVPDVSARPPVTDAHESAASADLQSLIDRAAETWSRVENPETADENLPGLADPERSLDEARDYLDGARDATGWEALFDVRQGADAAGRAIAGARLALDEASGEHLASQARDLQESVADVRDRVTYRVDDPSVGLARLYWVEKWLALATLSSYRDGTYAGQDEPTRQYEPHSVVSTWGEHMQSRRCWRDAERLYADYREATAGRQDLRPTVLWAERHFRQVPDHVYPPAEIEEERAAIEALPEGPYRTFRWQIHAYARGADVRTDGGPWADLLLYRAVKNGEAALRAGAAEAVGRTHALDRDTDAVDGTLLARTKRRGLSLLRARRREARDRPLLALLLREGRRLLWAGDTQLEGDADVDHPRARAYARYALAVAYLRDVEGAAGRLDEPG